jgi:pyruvate ferredoxin oxidoreductase alpha subunit
MLDSVVIDDLPKVTFLDLDEDLVQREIDRNRADRRSGPAAENMLRDLGAVRATSA